MDAKKQLHNLLPHIPESNILTGEAATREYGLTTFSDDINLDAAVLINKRSEIIDIVKMANKEKFVLYPISTGKNWGYGAFSGQTKRTKVLLDLSRLTAIYPVDKKLGLISVEPGVTQQMLWEYLVKNDWPWMVPVNGAGPNCGILSNALERGYGITPITEHFEAVTAIKVVLGHPDLATQEISSGVSELDASGDDFIDKTFKYGVGPYIDGLFTQSNLGIVTECTIRLAPRPEAFSAFYVRCFNAEKLPLLVEAINRILRDFEGIVGSVNLMDRRRVITMSAHNPNEPGEHKVMDGEQVAALSKKHNTPEWIIMGTIYGTPEVVKAVKHSLASYTRGIGKPLFSDSLALKVARWLSHSVVGKLPGVERIKQQLNALDESLDIMLGKPNQLALPLAYWRNPNVRPDKSNTLLPAQDGCGLLWYAPLIPLRVEKIEQFIQLIRTTTPAFGIEPLITFTFLRHNCVDSTVPIVFNKSDKTSRDNALKCCDELVRQGLKSGFVPYRLNTLQQQSLPDKDTLFWQTIEHIKQTLDPNRIINPGRYNPHN